MGRGSVTALAAALALAALAGCHAPDTPPRSGAPDPLALVDPFLGTGGHGHVYPGATVPFGMVQPSPDNGQGGWDWVSGYNWSDSVIVGFSQTHLSGTGIGDLLDVLVQPVKSPVPVAGRYPNRLARPYAAAFSHDDETARPGYYAVTLGGPAGAHADVTSGIRVELTATDRVALHRWTYPAGAAAAGAVVDLGYAMNWDRTTDAALALHGDSLVTGLRFSSGWADDERVFFALRADRPILGVRMADGGTPLPEDQTSGQGTRLRALLDFGPLAPGTRVTVAVALSYVDGEGALENLRAEAPELSFDEARGAAALRWRRQLDKVRVRGGTPEQRTLLATSFYRTRLAPVLFQDVDGRYRGGDGQVHTARDFTNYTIFSLWDTFRAAHPLYTVTDADRVSDLVGSMLAFSREYGYLPVWSLVGNETNTMTGHHGVPVVVDAVLKGEAGGHGEAALAAVLNSSYADHRGLEFYKEYGFIPSDLETESVTKTLEYAYDDWSAARLARAMGDSGRGPSASWLAATPGAPCWIPPRASCGAATPTPPGSRTSTRAVLPAERATTTPRATRGSTPGSCPTTRRGWWRPWAVTPPSARGWTASSARAPKSPVTTSRRTSRASSASTPTATSPATTSPTCTPSPAGRTARRTGCGRSSPASTTRPPTD